MAFTSSGRTQGAQMKRRALFLESLECRWLLSTLQTFDGGGSAFKTYEVFDEITPPIQPGGPIGLGSFLRLADGEVTARTLSFAQTDAGAFGQIVADFDFRMTPIVGRADGFGFALLNTDVYSGTTDNAGGASEEPNFQASLGVGFDIYQSDALGDEGDDIIRPNFSNSISIHFNSQVVRQETVTAIDLAGGEWIHARIIMRPGDTVPNVSVILTPTGKAPVTVINKQPVDGFAPYPGRVHFGARSGGESANHDLDNINVQYSGTSQALLSFGSVSYTVAETQATARLEVVRSGNTTLPATVQWSTSPGSAQAGSDFVSVPLTTLSFAGGEVRKTITVPLANDAALEGEQTFRVSLSNPSGVLIAGPATAGVTILDDETAQVDGQWTTPQLWPEVAIHSHVLPTGQVMIWNRFGDVKLWDPATDSFTTAAQPGYNLFCSGHAFLPDGKLLVTGGHHHDGDPADDFMGLEEASVYDPYRNTWTALPPMNAGRWYPTNTTLPNGEMLVLSGTVDVGDYNDIPQIWQPASNTWRELDGATDLAAYGVDLYPRMFVLPNNPDHPERKLVKVGPDKETWYLNTDGAGTWTQGPDSNFGLRTYGSAVMYEPGKVLIVGGGRADDFDTDINGNLIVDNDATATAEIIDFTQDEPVWQTVDAMQFARRHLNATLLPDGSVLVTGGVDKPGFNNETAPQLAAERWDPVTKTWSTLALADVTRGYHSTAILLPDGRVVSAGGGEGAGAVSFHNDAEIFSPPYLFQGPRPTINLTPSSVAYGQSFFVGTPSGADIEKVSLVRLPSATHAFDENQRFNALTFSATAGGLNVTAPANGSLAPPGHYMLFILNAQGVPSAACIIHVRAGADNAPPTIGNLGGSLNYTENAAPSPVSIAATVSDPNSANFGGGSLVMRVAANAHANDRFTIANQGTAAGQIGVSGASVTFGGTLIGTVSGGSGATPLIVTFNNAANSAAAQALIRALRFRTLGETPSTLVRRIVLSLSDGDGGPSGLASKLMSVTPLNDAPILDTTPTPSLNAVVEDATNPRGTLITNFARTAISDADAGARKGIAVTAAGTANGQWQYSLNDGATWIAMTVGGPVSESSALLLPIHPQARLRFLPKANFYGEVKLWYRAWDQTAGTTGGRLATGGNTGGTKSMSAAVENAKLTVTPVNDKPVLTLSGSLGYRRNDPAIVLAPNATVADIDSANFGGGRLRVRITQGGGNNNTLAIGGGFTVDAGKNVKFGDTIIGKRLSSGIGTSELKIQFYAAATKALVQQLVRSITYRNVGGSAGTRIIAFDVSDGDGGLSDERLKTVNVN